MQRFSAVITTNTCYAKAETTKASALLKKFNFDVSFRVAERWHYADLLIITHKP